MNEGVNQEAIPDVDIQYPDQDVATGPDYGSGDLIAFKVIDIPGETPDGEMSPPPFAQHALRNQNAKLR